jgi:hypothetical protein
MDASGPTEADSSRLDTGRADTGRADTGRADTRRTGHQTVGHWTAGPSDPADGTTAWTPHGGRDRRRRHGRHPGLADYGGNARPLDGGWRLRRAAAVWATNQPGQLGSRTTGTGPATAATVSCRCYSAVQLAPRRTAVVCWIWTVRVEGNGTKES